MPAKVGKVDIHTLLERPASASSRGNGSSISQPSTGEETHATASTSTTARTTPPAAPPGPPLEPHQHQHYPMMQTAHYPSPYPPPGPPSQGYPPLHGYSPYHQVSMSDPRLPPPIPLSHVGPSNKRLAPAQPHPSESPAKKKQSKWTAEEDAAIIELRGNGMKWEDISKHLPGRSAISCRLRFQNYLERRSEWDEEKKNKLARLYER